MDCRTGDVGMYAFRPISGPAFLPYLGESSTHRLKEIPSMKLPHAVLLTGLTTALLFGTAPDVSAQLVVGVQGTLADVRSVSGGLGGRVGYV